MALALIPSPPRTVRPRTSAFWKTSSAIAIGTAAITVPAITRLGCWSALSRSALSPLCTVFMSASVVISVRPQVLVPGRQEAEQCQRAQRRPHDRHGDVTQEREVAGAVDACRVTQLTRQRQERLANQERAERGGERTASPDPGTC